jgi:hypothetical protein
VVLEEAAELYPSKYCPSYLLILNCSPSGELPR